MKNISLFSILIFLLYLVSSCGKEPVVNNNNNNPSNNRLTISGIAKSCNGSSVGNGYLIIMTNTCELTYYPIVNGVIDTTIESNNNLDSILVWAVDLDSLKTSDTLWLGINNDSLNLNDITVCHNDVDEYIRCKINNETYTFVPASIDSLKISTWDTLNAPTTYFYRRGYSFMNSPFYQMQLSGMALGTYYVNWNSSIQIGRYYSFNMPNTGYISYTKFGQIGDYIEGVLNVPFIDNTDNLSYTLTGDFKVRRDN